MNPDSNQELSILIVSENASAVFGGEAVLPLHYFRRLRNRGISAFLLTHERNRDLLLTLLPEDADRLFFVPDSMLQQRLSKLAGRLPTAIGRVAIGPIMNWISQSAMRRRAMALISKYRINVVHQPMPVSPKTPSMMYRLGVPVIIGPLNGGMNYPIGFRHLEGSIGRWLVGIARAGSHVMHKLFPGKLEAHTVLVANLRSRDALPKRIRGNVIELAENGVDLQLWERPSDRAGSDKCDHPLTFVFVGRLVNWKGVDLLIQAVSIAREQVNIRLRVIGDGIERIHLEKLTQELGLSNQVQFLGWLPQPEIADHLHEADVFILPSVWECGGAVVLEAMAAGTPVIATDWGGPADYIEHESTGLLVKPTNPKQFPIDLAAAMVRLVNDKDLRTRLAVSAIARVRSEYDWEKKIDKILEIYKMSIFEQPRGVHPNLVPSGEIG